MRSVYVDVCMSVSELGGYMEMSMCVCVGICVWLCVDIPVYILHRHVHTHRHVCVVCTQAFIAIRCFVRPGIGRTEHLSLGRPCRRHVLRDYGINFS